MTNDNGMNDNVLETRFREAFEDMHNAYSKLLECQELVYDSNMEKRLMDFDCVVQSDNRMQESIMWLSKFLDDNWTKFQNT